MKSATEMDDYHKKMSGKTLQDLVNEENSTQSLPPTPSGEAVQPDSLIKQIEDYHKNWPVDAEALAEAWINDTYGKNWHDGRTKVKWAFIAGYKASINKQVK